MIIVSTKEIKMQEDTSDPIVKEYQSYGIPSVWWGFNPTHCGECWSELVDAPADPYPEYGTLKLCKRCHIAVRHNDKDYKKEK